VSKNCVSALACVRYEPTDAEEKMDMHIGKRGKRRKGERKERRKGEKPPHTALLMSGWT
jgi:hypothetical protein